MSKRKKFVVNFIILVFATLFMLGVVYEFRLTPLGVHEYLEKKSYYGPSEIINTIKEDRITVNICKYDEWYSVDEAEKNKFGLWYPRHNQPHYVVENKKDKPLTINPYYFGQALDEKHTRYEWMIWGVINDENIKDVRLLVMDDGNLEVLEENHMKDGTYIFRWENSRQDYEDSDLMIVGLDENENVIYKVNYRGQEYE